MKRIVDSGRATGRWRVGIALLAFGLSPTISFAQTDGASSQAWRSDLAELPDRLEARHPNPYHAVSREAFRAELDRLVRRADEAEDYEIAVGLARLMALVGDGHTGAFLAYDFDYGRYPFDLWNLDDGLLIAAASSEHPDLVGGRVLSIGGVPAIDLIARVDPLVSRDNDYALRGPRPLLSIPRVLAALGVVGSPDLPVEMEVERSDGRRTSVSLAPLPSTADIRWEWGRDREEIALWLRDRVARYWFEPLPSHHAVYVQYNDASRQDEDESLLAFGDRLVRYVSAHGVDRVILDLRWNDGGSDRWTNILLHALIRIEHALGHPRTQNRDPGPPLFVLTGPVTFSAATNFALDLEEHTNAVFVGEPTGGRPVGFSGRSFIDLPRTGVRLRSSYEYQINSFSGDDRAALFPDVAAPPTIAAYRENRDPALEAALAWTPRPSIADRLETAARRGGLERAREVWAAWRDDPSHRWLDSEGDVNAAGYRLLRDGETAPAVVLFRVNAEVHPGSANAHDSLGEALVASGDIEGARAAYARALELDPDGPVGSNARRMLQELRAD